MHHYLSLADFETKARARLPRAVREFVRCGSEDGRTLQANRDAFARFEFLPRGLVDVSSRSQAVRLWDTTFESPFGIAPMGFTGMCRQGCDMALATQATQLRIPYVLSGLSTTLLEDVLRQAPGAWYQAYIPPDRERIRSLLNRLVLAEVKTLVVTIDTAVGSNREHNIRTGMSMPLRMNPRLTLDGLLHPRWAVSVLARTLWTEGVPRFCNFTADARGFKVTQEHPGGVRTGRDRLAVADLEWIRNHWGGRLVVKGVMHPKDAALCVAAGADGLIVSNHGGRQLDAVQGSLAALPAVVSAVPKDFPVMVDGGFRRGTDVLKAIALGARLVFIGRPMLWAAAVAGPLGVRRAIQILKTEIDRDQALLGCPELSQLDVSWLAGLAGAPAAAAHE